MSLTITSTGKQIIDLKSTDPIETPLYGFVQFGSNFIGKMDTSLRIYKSKQDCEKRVVPLVTNIRSNRIIIDLEPDQVPSLEIAELKWKEQLEIDGFYGEINIKQ